MRFVLPLLFGVGGGAVLVALGFWQLDRLDWKEGMIARIEARLDDAPVPLPDAPDQSTDDFRAVTLSGQVDGQHIRVLGAWRNGTGYRIIAPVDMGDRRVMVDLGIIPTAAKDITLPDAPLAITGNLAWPEEANASTPVPSAYDYYARDVPAMARWLKTEPVLVVARTVTPDAGPSLAPVGTDGIRNSHLGYAIQWFGLALVWLGMTAFFLWRMTRRTE
ncbi:MAG: SURF1 family protein [Pseudomonadota bacterium]